MKKSIMPQRWLLIGILIFFSLNVACSQGIHSMPFVAPTDPAIGKPCPDVELNHIINYPESQARISDFRGKILIIDFYTTIAAGAFYLFRNMILFKRNLEIRYKYCFVPVNQKMQFESYLVESKGLKISIWHLLYLIQY